MKNLNNCILSRWTLHLFFFFVLHKITLNIKYHDCCYNFRCIMWQTFHDICTSNMTVLYTKREHGEDFSFRGLPPHHSVCWLSALRIILYEGQQNGRLITQLNLTTKPAHCLKAERPASCYHRSTAPSSLAKQGTLQCCVEPLRELARAEDLLRIYNLSSESTDILFLPPGILFWHKNAHGYKLLLG